MAWEEWEQLKAEAAQKAAARTRLNQVDPSTGPGADGDLVVHDAELGQLGGIAYRLRDRLRKDSDHAREATFGAAVELSNEGLDIGAALTELHDAWNSKSRTLVDACGHISNHLDFTRAQHKKDDDKVATSVSASAIDKYMK
ncbi:hypothetical protein [Streptomyces flavofungini]|uniref:AG1 protein n=1 Tax=Streptomyces flavofungini TaxID=68200 RepID=A0ABS0X6H7_9ACTN|nr:hypothetical protein [Streptomyces flavofungini]MBJ3808817.1 hypothetical protein [Streptomyces flavofungini]GHC49092.1 hypothetical protein GCM10010349_13180 [Streptomyces flavofungini]